MKRRSLIGRLAFLVSLGFAAIWLLSMFVTGLALRSEQTELFDEEIDQIAHLFRPIVTQALNSGFLDAATINAALQSHELSDVHEALVYQILHISEGPIIESRLYRFADVPTGAIAEGFSVTGTHTFYTTDFNDAGYAVRVGDPLEERREAFYSSLIAFLLPMLAMIPLAYVLVHWIAHTALRPLEALHREISNRGEARLDPIDASSQPPELAAITTSLNGFIIRLSKSLETERAFASVAAHELRTPIAVALAQVQRLKVEMSGSGALVAITKVEDALQRMARRVARLLQMARADAGVGMSSEQTDIGRILRYVVNESEKRSDNSGRMTLDIPDAPVVARMDADAFGIIAGNLIDNALQHGAPGQTLEVTLSPDGVLRVVNEGAVVPPEELKQLTKRLHQGPVATDGFGLGLYIIDTISRQVGSSLELYSPAQGRPAGFEARFAAPMR